MQTEQEQDVGEPLGASVLLVRTREEELGGQKKGMKLNGKGARQSIVGNGGESKEKGHAHNFHP